ncbi:MAG: MaoC family dehydratase [Cyclobacteriaceae bacterium]|nr:MaoC family dehydratase [Cyclobacteriaceae bacterium]MCX7637240.1 MaoC family dehydratase [Cyclobacteriaceae bacterium]MDW8331948.1 MaoC family dehydratase [Cyclobacteriaceae bacterium]
MSKVVIRSFDEFARFTGKEIGTSGYHTITQDQIDLFAKATLDFQWIHINPERAREESPFGGTIAHGYLTLSLIPYLWDQIAEVRNYKMLVNYGIEELRFNQPVRVNDQVRLHVALKNITNLRGIAKAEMNITMEIKDNPKPAFTGTILFLYHFK